MDSIPKDGELLGFSAQEGGLFLTWEKGLLLERDTRGN